MSADRWSRWYVVVSGPPASGKSSLARELAAGLALPLIAKDTIKEALMRVLDVPDVQASRVVGRAAVAALYAVAAEAGCGVLESAWHRSVAKDDLANLPGSVVEVFCRCDREVARARYEARVGSRGVGHFDGDRVSAELWNDEVSRPVAAGWPVLDVDTNRAVDVAAVIERLQAVMQPTGGY